VTIQNCTFADYITLESLRSTKELSITNCKQLDFTNLKLNLISFSSLTKLSINKIQVESIILPKILNLTKLEISHCPLQSINLKDCDHISVLILSNNKFTKFNSKEVLNANNKLEKLDLSKNLITEFEGSILQCIIQLNLELNQLTQFISKDQLPRINSIKLLDLTSNQLTKLDIETLNNLQTLNFLQNPLATQPNLSKIVIKSINLNNFQMTDTQLDIRN